jgi:hypothetical protein
LQSEPTATFDASPWLPHVVQSIKQNSLPLFSEYSTLPTHTSSAEELDTTTLSTGFSKH